MKYLPIVAGILLGLLFVFASATFFLGIGPEQKAPPEGSTMAHAGAAFGTGWMHFVKVFELLGGVLVAIPRTRNLGLLVLGPIILNILAFCAFVAKWQEVPAPMIAIIVVIPLYLLWVERRAWAVLLAGNR